MKAYLFLFWVFLPIIGSSQIIINEVQSSNNSTLADNYGEYEDWIELYNPTDSPVEIGGLVLKDNVDTWQIPTGDTATIIPSNGFFLLWADDEGYQGKFHTNFKLSASNGEFLGIYEKDSITLIESVNIPPLDADESYGKCNNNWTTFSKATPLNSNDCSSGTAHLFSDRKSIIRYFKAENIVIFEMAEPLNAAVEIELYTLNGRLIAQQTSNQQMFTFNNILLNNTFYLVKILSTNFEHTEKIMFVN